MSQLIPRSMAPAEVLVRGILHPFFYSKSADRVKPEAFLPPPGQADVSVLRLAYTQEDFCKAHCRHLRIGDSVYVGMAALRVEAVEAAARQPAADPVKVIASPLDEANKPLADDASLTTTDPGLPMHADLLYSMPTVRGIPVSPALKVAARYLANPARSIYYADPQPETEGWQGGPLSAPTAA